MRIDAHQHYWRFDPVRNAWITSAMAALRRDCLPDHVAADLRREQIDGVIAVQADQSDDETRFLVDLAARHASIRGVVGWIDLRAHDLDDRLARWRSVGVVRGFRHIAQAEADDFLARPDVVRGVRLLARHNFSYDLLVYPRQLDAAEQLVRQCPDVRFVLDHCAKPPIASGDIDAWRQQIGRIAGFANVWCKVSGLVTEAVWQRWTAALIVPYIEAAAEAFGTNRLIFGSDWPVCLLAASYAEVMQLVTDWAESLSLAERASIFGGAAMHAYRLEG